MRFPGFPRGSPGFSLLELLIALVLFQVGLLAVAGMLIQGQHVLRRSELVLRGTLESRIVGDSLFKAASMEPGEREEAWGRIVWEPVSGNGGSLRVMVLAPRVSDTLVVMRLWPPREGGS